MNSDGEAKHWGRTQCACVNDGAMETDQRLVGKLDGCEMDGWVGAGEGSGWREFGRCGCVLGCGADREEAIQRLKQKLKRIEQCPEHQSLMLWRTKKKTKQKGFWVCHQWIGWKNQRQPRRLSRPDWLKPQTNGPGSNLKQTQTKEHRPCCAAVFLGLHCLS